MSNPIIKQPDYPAPNNAMKPRPTQLINVLIWHHGDNDPMQSPLSVDEEHRGEGWAMIGYDYYITADGTIYKGRPDNVEPSAAYGDNWLSVDVCLAGDFQPGTPSFQASVPVVQLQSAKDLAVYLHKLYPGIVGMIGHRDVAALYPNDRGDYSTACPGDILENLIPSFRTYVHEQLGK